ncbi:ATP-binding protein [Pseudaestuariivita atlantica]|uniref:ATP-binding protein n=1 Tax=Pseudaestuariivita atlantica TaxID=1317121 RepID=UPI00067DCF49|nr:ATP-binding protein [Pseudaestuariivita atlantica]
MKVVQLRPTGRTLRAVVAVGIVGVLIILLLAVRGKLEGEEKRASYVMSSLSWKVSETLLESQKLVTAFVEYEDGAISRDDVIVATELLWSRMDVLQNSEFNTYKELVEAGAALQSFLDRHEEEIYDAPTLQAESVAAMRAELSKAAQTLRAIWIKDFLGDRERLHDTATQDIADARTLFERLILGCVITLAIYMIAEIRGAQQAQVRERALREQALSASEAKTNFLANVSHEIRTPLNGVIGMAQELAETPQTGEQSQMTGVILSSAELLLSTINDVLDISKIESGRLGLDSVAFLPAERIELSAALYEPAITRKGLAIEIGLHCAANQALVGDPLRFTQVVNNLVSNAVKFTEEGRITVGLSCRPLPGSDMIEVQVTVRDTGPGIPEGALTAIFEPFSQADNSTTRTHGGTGLGLTISRAICREMGGDIAVETTIGEGSTFIATFTMAKAAPNDVVASIRPVAQGPGRDLALHVPAPVDMPDVLPEPPQGRGDRPDAETVRSRILLVDDSATNRMVMKRLLKTLNADIDEAESGLDAVERATHQRYDLILMDIQMPGMDGVEATCEIRAHEQASADPERVPIIAVTANVMAHQVNTYLAQGMDRVVAKPVRKTEILDVIGEIKGGVALH